MLVKILGAIDIFAGLILMFGAGIKVPTELLLILGGILVIKSFFGMFKEIGSWIDITVGIVLILSGVVSMPAIISLIFGILILQKGMVSFL